MQHEKHLQGMELFKHTLIQPSVARSKWNMGEICGLNFHLIYVDIIQYAAN